MANFTGYDIGNSSVELVTPYVGAGLDIPYGIDAGEGGTNPGLDIGASSGGAAAAPIPILQRMYDTGVAGWVYYSSLVLTTTPLVAETAPNHTNNLVAATHAVY